MKKFLVAAASLMTLAALPAEARTHISVGFFAPGPSYYTPAPVVYYPPVNHVYYAPRPVYYAPRYGYSHGYGHRNNYRRYDTAWNGRYDGRGSRGDYHRRDGHR